jgi:hypothetical protein
MRRALGRKIHNEHEPVDVASSTHHCCRCLARTRRCRCHHLTWRLGVVGERKRRLGVMEKKEKKKRKGREEKNERRKIEN